MYNQIVKISFTAWSSSPVYEVTVTRKDGTWRSYGTKHRTSIAFDWLSDCVNNKKWIKKQTVSLSVYPILTFEFKERKERKK